MTHKDLRQSPPFVTFIREIGWEVVPIGEQFAYIKKIPFTAIIKIHRFNPPLPYVEIDQLAKKYQALFVKIEPNSPLDAKLEKELKEQGFGMENWSFAPTKTIVIDLNRTEEEILKGFEKDTRYSIRLAQRKGVVIKESPDIEEFLPLFKDTAKRKGFWTGSINELKLKYEAFKKANQALLLLAFAPGEPEPVAGALTYFSDFTAYYCHAASQKAHRDLMAPYLLVWEIVKQAKKRGARRLDLEGMYDKRIPSTRGWKGFSHFKKGFGEEVTFLGSFTKFYNPLIKLLFKLGNLF